MEKSNTQFIRWFSELSNRDVGIVGGKNASLGEMYRRLTPQGVRVPNGFAITAQAYFYFLEKTKLRQRIRAEFKGLNTRNISDLLKRGAAVRRLILSERFPKELEAAIRDAYQKLEHEYSQGVDVAVRSSATAEDLPEASFAGQQESYLNIRGVDQLLSAAKHCMASLFTNRAISYRHDKHFDHFKVGLSVGVQKMVRSDKASSGVMFTLDTETGFPDMVLINSSWGLGENVVKGRVNPDEYAVFKPTLKKGFRPIIKRQLGSKEMTMVYRTKSQGPRTKNQLMSATLNTKTPRARQNSFSLTDREVLKLAEWGMQIEKHYKRPMDIEWAKDGQTGQLFIVQARPETVQAAKNRAVLERYSLKRRGKVLVQGMPVGEKIATGKVHVIRSARQIKQFKPGEILVTTMTDPDWEPIMRIAGGIITDLGGRTAHAAIISRELGIPCIVGTRRATTKLRPGRVVTMSCAEGEVGYVYEGKLPFVKTSLNLKNIRRPKTKVMMNVGEPDVAFRSSFLPNDGVGLARQEFIVANRIKAHPLALLHFNRLKDQKAKRQINQLTVGYPNKSRYYVDKLAEGIGSLAAAFYPKDVIIRLSDFKSNEYANLLGGKQFEPIESNPMIGWRGASRYYSPQYERAFALECQALVKAREQFGLRNIKVMVPFCRTVEEGKQVLGLLAKYGLKRGVKGLELYVMCEIPSNVILAEEFSKIFDGFSIGSNDLTQLTLGVDRDSELVAHIYNERNAAVKSLISQVIKVARKNKRKIGICGQAPSDFPDFARFLVREGIDSISLNPDTVVSTTLAILREERRGR